VFRSIKIGKIRDDEYIDFTVMFKRFSAYLLLLAALSGQAYAQDGTFSATVDKDKLALGDQLEVTFSLNGTGGGNGFQAPAFGDFVVLSGPNQSTNMQFINGSVSSSVSYSYILQPKAEGKFTIGPAFINYNGKKLQTQPITIVVTKGAPPQAQQKGGSANNPDISKQIGDDLFLKVSVDRTHVVQGEQITATYKIYTRINVVNYTLSKIPSLTGFWSEDLEVPKQIQLTSETVNGKQYRVGVLKKVALFAQRTGTLDIDPMEVTCVVQVQTRRRSNDIFDQFFNDPFFGNVSNINYKVRNDAVKISVAPLPTADVPANFSGAVGVYSMNAWLDKQQTKTNEPVTLKVKISGRGNLKLLGAPGLTLSPDIDKYDPKISDNLANQGDQIAGSRTFEYLLIPRHAGQQKIPSIVFPYYDIEKKRYVSLTSSEFQLDVQKGNDLAAATATGISKEDIKLLGEDIRFIKSDNSAFTSTGEVFFGSPSFYVLSVSPLLAFVGFVFYARRREKVLGDVVGLKNRRARKMAQQRLAIARKLLHTKKKEEFYTEISRALWGYIGDKLGIPPADLSTDSIRSALTERHVPEESLTKFLSTIEQCEFARFAPSADSFQLETVYSETLDLISRLEDHLS